MVYPQGSVIQIVTKQNICLNAHMNTVYMSFARISALSIFLKKLMKSEKTWEHM